MSLEEEPQVMKAGNEEMDADVLFLGAGPGGYVGAIRAGQLGLRTVCVEKRFVGGTCLNIGCIPTKALLSSVEALQHIKRGEEFGIEVKGYEINLGKMMDRKQKVVNRLVKGVEYLFRQHNVRLVRGVGRIIDKNTVEVETEGKKETIIARNIIIATGSVPGTLPIPGLEIGDSVWTSDEILQIREIPGSLLVIGGGAIGLEFGYMFARLGSKVTLVELMDQIVPASDTEMAKELTKAMEHAGMKILTGTTVTKAEDAAEGKKVTVKGPDGEKELQVDKILVAVGRKAVIQNIGLESVGVKTERNRIVVDDRMRTNVPGVYAIGDVIGEPMLAHTAFHEGVVAVENCMGTPARMHYNAFPAAVYTAPEYASVGLTEAQARERYGDVNIGRFSFIANGKALGAGETEGSVKMIVDPRYGEILGVHIVGPHATALIAEAVLAMQSEATVDEIIATIHPHPTLSEPLHEAALDTKGMALHK